MQFLNCTRFTETDRVQQQKSGAHFFGMRFVCEFVRFFLRSVANSLLLARYLKSRSFSSKESGPKHLKIALDEEEEEEDKNKNTHGGKSCICGDYTVGL